MAKRIVMTKTDARGATRVGLVRVLLVSLVLVVVLLAVAYAIFE